MSILSNGLVFAGTRGLATRCILFIIETCGKNQVSAILGVPRNQETWWSDETNEELWEVADRHGIPYLQSMNDLSGYRGFLVSMMWDKIFPAHILARFDRGGINFHPAPLPQYRGSFARAHAILNGDKSFGVTVHYLSEGVDTGDIIGELKFPLIASETALSLDTRTQRYGYALFCEVWLRLLDGSSTRRSQAALIAEGKRESRLYTTRMITELLDSAHVPRSAEQLERLYRALYLPPRFTPPNWLVERVLTSEVRTIVPASYSRGLGLNEGFARDSEIAGHVSSEGI
ncbi:formyltransferase family protein [Bradyrhizobium zhanjiangense]|uniref:Formyl transferase domain-containing protein n=1 Tax=Bradyrhizobium zhanjiangense TaxID=1325107 RepID=A0ABY0D9D6_9BRAD|nr:formyltransferase family protein [Bradyrhizobium zhanjiangense]RXG85912.1 formyl transferase domain-containing protein [Bradyrhizobium zhanjiangense]